MVETITPVVHGGRNGRWATSLVLHAVGATLAAAAFGGVLGGLGALLGAPWGAAGLVLVVSAAALYLLAELGVVRVPVPQLRRQVPDWWRTFFGFGPAAFLYGLGLGVGFLTYLTHGTLVVVATAAVASGRPGLGAALMGPFGLARGLSSIVARRARTPEQSGALIGRLAEAASWRGWTLGHAVALAAVLVTGAVALSSAEGAGEPGRAAGAVLAVAFGAAGAIKLARPRRWRRALASYGLPRPVELAAARGVPVVELVPTALALLGAVRAAAAIAVGLLVLFSAAIVVARVRSGPRLGCGCFGAAATRDYRVLLARNLALGSVAALAWLGGSAGSAPRFPDRAELLPATLVVGGLALVGWVGYRAARDLRRRDLA